MIATALLQFVLLAIHNDRRDLLVHKYQDGAQDGGQHSQRIRPRGILERRYQPTAVGQCRLELGRNFKFGRCNVAAIVEHGHRENGDNYREVADELTHLIDTRRAII